MFIVSTDRSRQKVTTADLVTASQTMNTNLTDPTLRPFLSPTFSPVDYLNSTLPSSTATKQQQSAPPLSALASQTQSHISILNAQTTRLSATLTGLTDDILRTSSRLTYEVELLRGEALSLADSLSSRGDLHESIRKFVPDGLDKASLSPEPPHSPSKTKHSSQGQLPPPERNAQDNLQTLHP